MSDTYKFQDVTKNWTLVVKKDFLTECPNPETLTVFELNSKHHMFSKLHSTTEPAIQRHDDGRKEFWVDGKRMEIENPELAGKMLHDWLFNQKLNNTIE